MTPFLVVAASAVLVVLAACRAAGSTADIHELALLADRRDAQARYWRCHHEHCGRSFVHARYLASHLIELHGEGVAR